MSQEQCLAKITQHLPDVIKYSGYFLFRLGKYSDCLNTEGMRYNHLSFEAKGFEGMPMFYGCCLPRQCSNTTVQEGFNTILDQINSTFRVFHVQNQIDTFQQPYNWAFFLFLIICCILVITVLAATCFKSLRKHQIVSAFAIQNTTKIFKYHQNSRLNVLNGVRSLSMFWVILGHSYTVPIGGVSNLMTLQGNVMGDFKFLVVQAGLYAVDAFFFIGGFLISYAFLKQQAKTGMKYFLAVVNRILRFWPSYFMAILLFYAVLPHTGSGPFWQNAMKNTQACNSMWRPLLFADNLVDNANNMCMGWGWYIQNDMQLFVFCILILLIYSKSKFCGFGLMFLAITANFAFVMSSTYNNGYRWITHFADTAVSAQYQLDIYYKPWGRCPPYIYGLFLGILYSQFLAYEAKQKEKLKKSHQKLDSIVTQKIQIEVQKEQVQPLLHKLKLKFQTHIWFRRFFELLGLFICIFICLIPRTAQGAGVNWPQFVHSIYLTYMKFFFVLGLSFAILPSLLLPSTHQDILIRFTMDTKAFNYVAKVSFCTYLVHVTILFWYYGKLKVDFYFSIGPIYFLFLAMTVYSILVGTVLVYLVEAPFTKLQKLFLGKILKTHLERKEKRQIKNKKGTLEIQVNEMKEPAKQNLLSSKGNSENKITQ